MLLPLRVVVMVVAVAATTAVTAVAVVAAVTVATAREVAVMAATVAVAAVVVTVVAAATMLMHIVLPAPGRYRGTIEEGRWRRPEHRRKRPWPSGDAACRASVVPLEAGRRLVGGV